MSIHIVEIRKANIEGRIKFFAPLPPSFIISLPDDAIAVVIPDERKGIIASQPRPNFAKTARTVNGIIKSIPLATASCVLDWLTFDKCGFKLLKITTSSDTDVKAKINDIVTETVKVTMLKNGFVNGNKIPNIRKQRFTIQNL